MTNQQKWWIIPIIGNIGGMALWTMIFWNDVIRRDGSWIVSGIVLVILIAIEIAFVFFLVHPRQTSKTGAGSSILK